MSETTEFDEVRRRARAALDRDDLSSVYLGILNDAGDNEFYLGNDVEGPQALQQAAATQLGMLCRVLADNSHLSVEEVAGLAAERATELGLER